MIEQPVEKSQYREWREVVPNDVKIFSQSPWGYWDGIQLVHMAHRLRTFPLSSNMHSVFVFRGQPTRYDLKKATTSKSVLLLPDSVSFIAALSVYEVECEDVTQEDIGVLIEPDFLKSFSEGEFHLGDHFSNPDPRSAEILKLLLEDYEKGSPFGKSYGDGLIASLCVHLVRTYSDKHFKADTHSGPLSPRAMREIDAFIRGNLDQKLSLNEVADVAGYSPYHLHRMFKQMTGETLHDYMMNTRLAQAKHFLTSTDWTVVRIAMETGFSDHSHLTRHFRRKYGLSPTQLRGNSR
jgi:AraC-like DNA-binding protein